MPIVEKPIQGSCLCGGVKFEVQEVVGPFELCHCNRCRKVSGSAFMAAVGVKRNGFRFLQGTELIKTFDAPIINSPPAYRNTFCGRCGSSVPDPTNTSEWFEIAAGTLEDELGVKPDKHIFVEYKAPWEDIKDGLPQYDAPSLKRLRKGSRND